MSVPSEPPAAQAGRVATQSAVLHWLETLATGGCDERTFLARIDPLLRGSEDAAWELLALLDQHYRRGKIQANQFQALKSHVQRLALGSGDDDRAIPASAPAQAPRPASTTAPVGTSAARSPPGTSNPVPEPAVATPPTAALPEPRPAAARSPRTERERMPGPGDVLRGRYRIVGVLGQGGMGTVFDAVDLERVDLPPAAQHLAVKVLHTAVMQRPALFAELRSEFQHLQTLSHPNIVRVHEFDRDGDTAFFTMELLRGCSLGQLLAGVDGGLLERPLAVGIIHDVGAALAHAHARGIVHGDINPSNIFITRDQEVRVLDFGASHKLKRGPWIAEFESRIPPPVATAGYASCQVLEGEVAEARDDVFAVACILYLLLTGAQPYQRRTALEAREQRLSPRRPPGLSGSQWRLLQQGLAFERERRPAAIDEWIARMHLEALQGRAARSANLAVSGGTRTPWIIAGTCALLVVAGIAAVTYPRRADLAQGGLPATGAATPALAPGAGEAAPPSEAPAAPPAAPALAQRVTPSTPTTAPIAHPIAAPAAEPVAPAAAEPIAPPATASIAPPAVSAPPATASASAASTSAELGASAATAAPAIHARVELAAAVVSVAATAPMALVAVHRKGSLRGDASFQWWTESGTAKAGADFIAIAPRIEHIADRKSSVYLAIPVVSDPTRRESRSFYVLIDAADPGTAIVTRTTTMVTIEAPQSSVGP
jgi:hypothetical protein